MRSELIFLLVLPQYPRHLNAAECRETPMDLVFMLDGSGSITNVNWELMKSWVKLVAENYDLGGLTQIGVVQFSHWFSNENTQPYLKTEIQLGKLKTKAQLKVKYSSRVEQSRLVPSR
ncbi:collagen alpha-1(XXI) chain-like [Styela clava]